MMRAAIATLLLFAATGMSSNRAAAQTNPNLENGLKPYGSYDATDFDSVDIGNGGLTLHIPLLSYPQRGSLQEKLYIVSFGKHWWVSQTCNMQQGTCISRWRWGANTQSGLTDTGVSIMDTNYLSVHFQLYKTKNWATIYTWDGSSRQLAQLTGGTQAPFDGTGYRMDVSSNIQNEHGDIIGFKDTNGNFFTPPNGTNPKLDTMARAIPTGGTAADNTGCVGPLPTVSATIQSYPGYNGGTLQVKTCYANGTVNTNFHAFDYDPFQNKDLIQELQATEQFVQTVITYDGSSWSTSPKWSFVFDAGQPGDNSTHYGDLLSVTLPTGGTISYTWTTGGTTCGGRPALIPVSRFVASRSLNANDGLGNLTTNYSGGVVTDPMGNDTSHVFTYLGNTCSRYETETDIYQGSHTTGTLLKTVKTVYQYQLNPFDAMGDGTTTTATNVFPTTITTIWANTQQSQIQRSYDSNLTALAPTPGGSGSFTMSYGKLTEEREYDYGAGAPGSLMRRKDYTYLAFGNSAYLGANTLDRVASETVYNGNGTQVAQTTYGYDEYGLQTTSTPQHGAAPYSVRANQTSVKRWLNTTGGTLNTITTYFDTGMPYQVTDPKGNVTTHAYSATDYGAYLTQTTMPLTGTVQHIVSAGYDFNTGKMTSLTDQNNQPFSYQYDALWRPTSANYPDGGQSVYHYPDLQTIQIQNKIDSSRSTNKYLHFDGLARPIRTMTANDESTPWDQVDTCYDGNGEKAFVSYAYQGNGLTDPPTCSGAGDSFVYDGLGRTTTLTHSDGTSVITSYLDASNHTGRATSVQDEGNGTQRVQRITQFDALGRLTSVCEVTTTTLTVGIAGSTAPAACGQDIAATGFLTSYAYDALDNLTSVTQGPLNGRSFVYDSLSRLTSSTNPEAGTTIYTYDADGNLLTKKDARNITVTYGYDPLNRLTGKTYSDSTPAVTYNYDQVSAMGAALTNTIGRKSSDNTAGTNTTGSIFSYDAMGHIVANSQCTPQNCPGPLFSLAYTYDLLGDIMTSTNGAGVMLIGSYNLGARLTSLASSLSDANHPGTLFGYTNLAHYNASGLLTSVTLGNNVNETRTYDARLRLCAIQGGSAYSLAIPSTPAPCPTGVSGYAPNSNIVAANDSVNGSWTYGYDPFNRITSSSQNGGTTTYSYAYDRFGNRWQQNVTHGSGTSSNLGFDANNRITASYGVSYDSAGNTASDGSTTYTYDAEGRIVSAVNGVSGSSSYVYDAEGRRIRKTTVAGGTVDFLYDLAGREITQISSAGSWTRGEVYADGSHLATYAGGPGGTTYFIHSDWQGSERARSNISGVACETIVSLPFGDAMTTSGSCADPSPMHLTGKEHDSETNLENFGARFDASSMGRFMTPDWSGTPEPIPYADYSEPQSLNLYAYLEDNPLNRIDSGGHTGEIQLVGKYTVRFDKNNQNDYPNIHIKKSGNDVARGRMMPDGHVEWAPNSVGASVLERARQLAIQKGYQSAAIERQQYFDTLRAAKAGRLTGRLSELSSILVIADIAVNAYYEHQTKANEPKTGWHFDALFGQVVVTDVDKAAKDLPVGSAIVFGNGIYTLGDDGKWRDKYGHYLVQCHNGHDICSTANAI